MTKLTIGDVQKIEYQIAKNLENLQDALTESAQHRIDRIKSQNRKAGRKYAKKIGLSPVENLGIGIRNQLNEKIISEVKRRKLKHYEIANSVCTGRSKVTAIMNRKLKNISTDLMIRILESLGIYITITFNNT